MTASTAQQLYNKRVSEASISKAELISDFDHENLEVAGVAYAVISDRELSGKLQPELTYEEVCSLLRVYFGRCIEADQQLDWADSRYSACWDAANWIVDLNGLGALSESEIIRWMDWLENIYQRGDDEVREAVEVALIEHVLQDLRLISLFSRWKRSAIMGAVFDRCLLNTDSTHGRTAG